MDPSRRTLISRLSLSTSIDDEQYLHWDELRYKNPPKSLSQEEWWLVLKLRRGASARKLTLNDVAGQPFVYHLPDAAQRYLHRIDLGAGGRIELPDPITNRETRDRYYVNSLIEEAFTSSQLEGAASTREIAKDMIRNKRKPRSEGEQMILNNYLTMKALAELKQHELTPELVCEIHAMITHDTLEDPQDAGRLRGVDRRVVVDDIYGDVLHAPPCASELTDRLDQMCRFVNGQNDGLFIHPAVRSMILHFWLAYDHPFIDGNGRTARALFYWSMLKHGYWLFEFISISRVILKAPTKYGRAFLHTETDGNDLTYFLLYHIRVVEKAIDELHAYIASKTLEVKRVETIMRKIGSLNHRQQAIISHALRHPGHRYTVESHQTSHSVTPQTARTDLNKLVDLELLTKQKLGRSYHYSPHENLENNLKNV